MDRIDTITQVATTGPDISQKLAILIIVATLLVAALLPDRANKPDIPVPMCEANQECEVYEIRP